MAVLQWDTVGDRVYENGLDRGVLYLPNGSAVPWNGLVSVSENSEVKAIPIYFDSRKIQDLVELGDFSGTIKAITYPNEFSTLQGLSSEAGGIFYSDQSLQVFNLCYRTRVSTDLNSNQGYKIHILYNVTATPSNKSYDTISESVSVMEFEWDILAIPEEAPGIRPTAHMIIDSRLVAPSVLIDLENTLYGTAGTNAAVVSMSALVAIIQTHYLFKITDYGNGTWTVFSPGTIPETAGEFTLTNVNGIADVNEFTISTTYAAGYGP